MKAKKLSLPKELSKFIDDGRATFHCPDGDWDLRIESREESEIGDELPPRSTVIAENGSGDFLFIKASPAGKFDPKVYVYWHEENGHEAFAKQLKDLMVDAAPKFPATGKKTAGPKKTPSTAQLQAALASPKDSVRTNGIRAFAKTDFDVDAIPLLRRALADNDVEVAITAANCIAKLGPAAAESAGAESSPVFNHVDLEEQLILAGGKIWPYSGYANCYSACLEALVKLELDEDFIVEFVHTHIGLSNPDDLLASLNALKTIGTRDAIDLLKRAAVFWMPELNMAQSKKVKAIVDSIGRSTK
jgi:hypothetical protein